MTNYVKQQQNMQQTSNPKQNGTAERTQSVIDIQCRKMRGVSSLPTIGIPNLSSANSHPTCNMLATHNTATIEVE